MYIRVVVFLGGVFCVWMWLLDDLFKLEIFDLGLEILQSPGTVF